MHPINHNSPLSPMASPLSPLSVISCSSPFTSAKKKKKTGLRSSSSSGGKKKMNNIQCCVCLETLDPRAFARPQRLKSEDSTCRSCVWKALGHCKSGSSKTRTLLDCPSGLLTASSSSSIATSTSSYSADATSNRNPLGDYHNEDPLLLRATPSMDDASVDTLDV